MPSTRCRIPQRSPVPEHGERPWTPVRSVAGCYSIWPAELALPTGWQRAGAAVPRAQALDATAAAWSAEPAVTAEPASDDTADRRFFELAGRQPSSIAAIQGADVVSYAQLADRVRQVRSGLSAIGVRPDDVVGVCIGRSVDLLAVLLGVLSCGAAYVPLDAKYPAARLAFMARDVGLRCIVSDSSSADALADVDCPVTSIDELRAAERRDIPDTVSSSSGLAYVMYTSGSTGLPKGVEVTNANLTSFLDAMSELIPAAAAARVLFSTPLSFDIAGLEVYWPLTTGGSCLVAPSTWLLNARSLAKLINHSEPTLLQATPVGWRLLLEAGARPARDQVVLCGGESLPASLAARLAALPGPAINVYGPTEATIWATSWPIVGDHLRIGRAMSHARAHVLDEQLGAAEEGELYLGGPAVARGYRHQLRLTAERFLPDPWSPEPGQRMYATGDVVRLVDGQLEWLRRSDSQVKFNGHRLELGEIEAIASKHEGIRAAVALIGNGSAGSTLSLYLETSDPEEEVRTRVGRLLRQHLPSAVVPTEIQVMPVLPLTTNGKVDRIALRAGGGAR